jgi:hypothetical protein
MSNDERVDTGLFRVLLLVAAMVVGGFYSVTLVTNLARQAAVG